MNILDFAHDHVDRLLLVDDEPLVLAALRRLLRARFGASLQIDSHTDPEAALAAAPVRRWDAVITDFRMPGMDGLEFLRRLREHQPHALRLVLSASAEVGTIMQAINDLQVFRYLVKPWQPERLLGHVEQALARAREERCDRELADAMRLRREELDPTEAELQRLEALEPGLTRVRWGPNGEVLMPPLPSVE